MTVGVGAPIEVRLDRSQASPTFTLQGLLEDNGAANAAGFSVTNAVVLRAQ